MTMREDKRWRLLNEAFQYVDDAFLDIVEEERVTKKRKPARAVYAAAAACLCLLVVLPISVIAAKWLGLWDLLLPKVEPEIDYFTLNDYFGSPEVLALREWKQFLAARDAEGIMMPDAEGHDSAAESREDWLIYGAYTQDMGERLDQIAEKYGLALHVRMDYVTAEELENRVGSGFLTDVNVENCQVYENGAFHFVGVTELGDRIPVFFWLSYVVKGSFEDSIPYMGGEDGYDEWQYESADGESVRLGLGTYDARILKECVNSRVIVDMPYGRNHGITKDNLQELANKIAFGTLMDMPLPEVSDREPAPKAAPISLSGYMESPESLALAEWQEFLEHYDVDHKIADQIGNGVFLAEGREDWSHYSVNSYEMGEKLDEIAGKYGLKLHVEENVIDQKELTYRVGGRFMDEELLSWGYMYEDGYFHMDGEVEMKGCGTTVFQITRSVKGTFNDVVLYVLRADKYSSWQFITACGEPVLLALGPYQAMIFADFEECFVTVNTLLGSEDGMTEEDLRELADSIDFRILKEVQVPDMRGDSEDFAGE